jgi:hypothetical protein
MNCNRMGIVCTIGERDLTRTLRPLRNLRILPASIHFRPVHRRNDQDATHS